MIPIRPLDREQLNEVLEHLRKANEVAKYARFGSEGVTLVTAVMQALAVAEYINARLGE